MALDLTPLRFDLPSVTQGDTYPAINFTETEADANLSSVRMKIANEDGTVKLTLDSASSGVTINTATAGAWDFTIGPITSAQTEALAVGTYTYDIETLDANSIRRTEFNGIWEILPQVTTT